MAPTTLLGQRTTSSPGGREASSPGYPIPITEMLALLPGVVYAARGSIADPQLIGRRRRRCSAARSRSSGRRRLVDRRDPVDLPGRLGDDARRGDGARRDRGRPRRIRSGVIVDRPKARARRAEAEADDGTRDDLRRLRRPGPAVRRPGPGRRPRCSRAGTSRGCRPTGPRCAAARRRAQSSSPTSRSARRSSTAPTRRRPQPAVDGEVRAAARGRAGCSSSTRR